MAESEDKNIATAAVNEQVTSAPIQEEQPKKKENILKRLYNWVLSWAESKYAIPALFILAFMESSFFPIPPDVLLIAMCLSMAKKSLRYAAVCTIGSVLGALFGYAIGYCFWEAVGEYFFQYIPGFTRELFATVTGKYNDNAFFAVFTSAFTPIPYKIFTIAAGVSKINVPTLVIASILGRGGRFFLVGGLFRLFGPKVKVFIDKYLNLLTLLLVVMYVLAFYLIPHLFGK